MSVFHVYMGESAGNAGEIDRITHRQKRGRRFRDKPARYSETYLEQLMPAVFFVMMGASLLIYENL